jgi:TldD protein
MVYLLSSTNLSLNNIIYLSKKLSSMCDDKDHINNIHNIDNKYILYTTSNFDQLYTQTYTMNQAYILIKKIYAYINKKKHIHHVILSIGCNKNHREIFNEASHVVEKLKCLWSLRINLTLKYNEKVENFYKSMSENGIDSFTFLKNNWEKLVDTVYNNCYDLLDAVYVNAGTKTIVCAPGECGTMIHEAVGHALESDFLHTNTSCFSQKQGTQIANPCVTVIDNGYIPNARGTIEYDDEGVKSANTFLIKDGHFIGELNNKFYSYKTKTIPSGNGRRESFAHNVLPRMTNTFLAAGDSSLDIMISKIQDGIFVKDIAGGQVDICTGAFVFDARSAYQIQNGKITNAIKGVMLMSNATQALYNIVEVGNDFSLCQGSGNCGKNGQMIPVCVGSPSFILENITVGGR